MQHQHTHVEAGGHTEEVTCRQTVTWKRSRGGGRSRDLRLGLPVVFQHSVHVPLSRDHTKPPVT
jgi:hypothetical protein